MDRLAIALLAAGCCAACDDIGPPRRILPTAGRIVLAPTPPPAPPPPAVPGETWTVTSTYAGHSGPPLCIPPFDGQPRPPIVGQVRIERADGSIRLLTEHDDYRGALTGGAFLATEAYDDGSSWTCGAQQIAFRVEGSVVGTFSADGRELIAEERADVMLASGETITRRWSWNGTRAGQPVE